jgi:hypothetical protein
MTATWTESGVAESAGIGMERADEAMTTNSVVATATPMHKANGLPTNQWLTTVFSPEREAPMDSMCAPTASTGL